mmetsp:Transcript_209/g.254  ORF Transcript_209/g.254 Transcript_209/m.254 type:complete len:121 (-) Transcript_209:43-405(-)
MITSQYSVRIVDPKDAQEHKFIVKDEYDEVPVSRLMNLLCFASNHSDSLDANFLAIYNLQTDSHTYLVERLLGARADEGSSGKAWIPYVNGKKSEWHTICEQDTRVTPNEEIVWRFETRS